MLNEAQKIVVTHRNGALLVLAGAGTGKTRTLTHRFAGLVSEGTAPERILLLTFTKKAAGEMHERAVKLLQNQGLASQFNFSGGTFHSTAFKWLMRLKKVESAFNIIDDRDQARLLKSLMDSERLSELTACNISINDLMHIDGLAKNLRESTAYVIKRFFIHAQSSIPLISLLLKELNLYKKKNGLVNFDDILEYWLELLTSPAGEQIRKSYDFIMVDEYQDTSRLQVELLKELSRGHNNIMAVGDDCQSIYSFRGALSDQMRSFCEDFNDAKIVKLEDNYRSSQPILDVCNEVIATSSQVFPKRLSSAIKKLGPDPLLVEGKNQFDVADQVLYRIQNNRENGIPLHEQAVIFRSSMHAMPLEKKLISSGIPYRKYGGLKLTEAAHVRDFMAIISCCFTHNPASWLRVLQLLPGVGDVTAQKALVRVQENKLDKFKFPAKAQELALELIELTREDYSDVPDEAFLKECAALYGQLLYLNYDDASSRLHDIRNLCSSLMETPSLSEFAAEILLDKVDPDEDETESALILSTIHSAKGKEWDCVYILNVADGAIPLRRSTIDIEEERRLLYVAMTRAREQLFLFWPAYSGFYGEQANHLSPFLIVLNKQKRQKELEPYSDFNDDGPDDELIYVYDDSGVF
jgi:DNA helicase II / ATP-dependent DNA helicase PcrA